MYLENSPVLVLPLKEFKPVVKFGGETFSQMVYLWHDAAVSYLHVWEKQVVYPQGELSWGQGARGSASSPQDPMSTSSRVRFGQPNTS